MAVVIFYEYLSYSFGLQVFYPPPVDEERVWLHAKFWFGVADSNYHEPVTHLSKSKH